MRNYKHFSWVLVVAMMFCFVACEKEGDAPELPPYETMAMDFSKFADTKSTAMKGEAMNSAELTTMYNYFYAGVTVGVWNVVLFTKLAVPVAAFKTAFTQYPVFLGKGKWQWSYTVEGFAGQYTARLTGEVLDEDLVWEMYISKSGINAFDETLWFSGVSAKDGSNGYWVLNHSAAYPEEMLRIDWLRESDDIGSLKYTYVRELNDNRETDTFKDSYIQYGIQESEYNLYYKVHAYDETKGMFADTEIEWSQTGHFGHVKSLSQFNDNDWHCWDENGADVDCE